MFRDPEENEEGMVSGSSKMPPVLEFYRVSEKGIKIWSCGKMG